MIWAALEATVGWSVIPPEKEFTLFIMGVCWQGGAILLGTPALTVVCAGTVGGGKPAEGAEEGGAEKGGATILVARG